LSENERGSRLADEGGRLGRLILAVDAIHDRCPVGDEAGFTVQTALKCHVGLCFLIIQEGGAGDLNLLHLATPVSVR